MTLPAVIPLKQEFERYLPTLRAAAQTPLLFFWALWPLLLLQLAAPAGPRWQLGQNITQLRRRSRLTQTQLAKHLQVTRQTVSRWETGQCMPERRHLAALSLVFGVTYDQLFDPPTPDGDGPRRSA